MSVTKFFSAEVPAQHWKTVLALERGGLRDIIADRIDQLERHGFTPDHDRKHFPINLIDAADAYVTQAQRLHSRMAKWMFEPLDMWPWDAGSFHPAPGPRANLVKAAALLLAAIDRIDAEAALCQPR